MFRPAQVAGWVLALMTLSGCTQPNTGSGGSANAQVWFPRNVQGNWVLCDVNPSDNVSAFPMLAMTFNPDQTYLMRLVKDGNRLEVQRGTYRFDEWNRRLYLHTGGQEQSYTAVVWFGRELRIEGRTPQNQAATATYVRSNLRVNPPEAPPTDRRPR
ncbi:MAG: hypothetical protein HRF43_05990 [Phycisphaerae bacterium]|jgi:hypothetical protein